jgi:hypothetical protein
MTTQRLTPDEATAFGRKLQGWAQGLPSNERTLLDEILARAVSTVQPEVQGYFTLIELTHFDPYVDAASQIAQAGDGSV